MAPRTNDRRLVRHLHGELSAGESRELEAELGRDPALAARLAELERLWRGLEPPAAEPEPLGEGARLARATLERERRRRERPLSWLPGRLLGGGLGPAPAWGRPLVAGALAAGLALGLWLGQPGPRGAGTGTEPPRRVAEARPGAPAAAPVEPAAEPAFAGEPTLAEAYLQAMEAGADYDWEGSGP